MGAPPVEAAGGRVRSRLEGILKREGFPRERGKPVSHSIDFDLLFRAATYLQDPDAAIADECYQGTIIGFHEELPRCPQVWPRKVKWKLSEDLRRTLSNLQW